MARRYGSKVLDKAKVKVAKPDAMGAFRMGSKAKESKEMPAYKRPKSKRWTDKVKEALKPGLKNDL